MLDWSVQLGCLEGVWGERDGIDGIGGLGVGGGRLTLPPRTSSPIIMAPAVCIIFLLLA